MKFAFALIACLFILVTVPAFAQEAEVETEQERLEGLIDARNAEIKKYEKRIATLETRIANIDDPVKVGELNVKLAKAERLLVSEQAKLERLEAKLAGTLLVKTPQERQEGLIEKSNIDIQKYENRITNLETRIANIDDPVKVGELNVKLTKTQGLLASEQIKLERLEAKLTNIGETPQEHVDRLESEINTLKSEINTLKSHIDNDDVLLDYFTNVINTYQKANDHIQSLIDAKQEKLDDKKPQLAKLQSKMAFENIINTPDDPKQEKYKTQIQKQFAKITFHEKRIEQLEYEKQNAVKQKEIERIQTKIDIQEIRIQQTNTELGVITSDTDSFVTTDKTSYSNDDTMTIHGLLPSKGTNDDSYISSITVYSADYRFEVIHAENNQLQITSRCDIVDKGHGLFSCTFDLSDGTFETGSYELELAESIDSTPEYLDSPAFTIE